MSSKVLFSSPTMVGSLRLTCQIWGGVSLLGKLVLTQNCKKIVNRNRATIPATQCSLTAWPFELKHFSRFWKTFLTILWTGDGGTFKVLPLFHGNCCMAAAKRWWRCHSLVILRLQVWDQVASGRASGVKWLMNILSKQKKKTNRQHSEMVLILDLYASLLLRDSDALKFSFFYTQTPHWPATITIII